MREIIEKEVSEFVETFSREQSTRTNWLEPLVGFADASDPLFGKLKEVVRPSHAAPNELLEGARTVIAFFLPFAKEIASSNTDGRLASREWAVAYVETNRLIIALNEHLAGVLEKQGYRAAKLPPTHNFDKQQLMSDWSHKHVGYIAGLGRFGLHHMLITEKGCNGRLGSLVTDAVIPATNRSDHEFCLVKAGKKCGKCVSRCVTGALTESGLDRQRCYGILLENMDVYAGEGMADVCGKCAGVVPCTYKNPAKAAK